MGIKNTINEETLSNITVADLGEGLGAGGRPDPGKKEGITEERKASRASKTKPAGLIRPLPLALGLDPPLYQIVNTDRRINV